MRRIIALLFIMVVFLSSCVVETANSNIEASSQPDKTQIMIHADWVAYNTAEELISAADTVLVGTITGIDFEIEKNKLNDIFPYTIYDIDVKAVYKGDVNKNIKIKVLGTSGINDTKKNLSNIDINKIPIINGEPTINFSQTYLFVLQDSKDSLPTLISFDQGALNINEPDTKKDNLPSIKEIVSYFGKEKLSEYEQIQHETATYIFKNAESISINSLEKLKEMRQMVECEDEETLKLFMRSVNGGGADSREDLVEFLQLIDSLPILNFFDGTVTWISHETGNSIDTGAYYDVIYVSTEAENGDWTRIEYLLSYDDVPTEMQKRKEKGEFADSTIKNPIQSKDDKIKVYAEKRKKHPMGTGDLINWTLDVDGIFVWVFYYTNNADSVITEDVFDKVNIVNIADM